MSSRVARIERRLAILTWQVCALTAIAAVAGVPALWMITGGDFSRLDPEDIDAGGDDGAALCRWRIALTKAAAPCEAALSLQSRCALSLRATIASALTGGLSMLFGCDQEGPADRLWLARCRGSV